jgi:hypothetical protein
MKKPNRSSLSYKLLRQYPLYLLRWQLSTPILAIVVGYFAYLGEWVGAALANLVGGLVFFWADRFIFRPRAGYRVQIKVCHSQTETIIKNARYTEIGDFLYIPLEITSMTINSRLEIKVMKGKEQAWYCWNAINVPKLFQNIVSVLVLERGESGNFNMVTIASGGNVNG